MVLILIFFSPPAPASTCSVVLEILFMCHVVYSTRDLIMFKANPEEKYFLWGVVLGGGGGVLGGILVFFEVAVFPPPFPSAAARTLGLAEVQGWDTTETSSRWQSRGGLVGAAATHFALDTHLKGSQQIRNRTHFAPS